MIKLKKISNTDELKMGKTVVSVDHLGGESLDKIVCIDNEQLYTESLVTEYGRCEGSPTEFLEKYKDVYEVVSE